MLKSVRERDHADRGDGVRWKMLSGLSFEGFYGGHSSETGCGRKTRNAKKKAFRRDSFRRVVVRGNVMVEQ